GSGTGSAGAVPSGSARGRARSVQRRRIAAGARVLNQRTAFSTARADSGSPSSPPTITSRSAGVSSNVEPFSIVRIELSDRVTPAALTDDGSPFSAATARTSVSSAAPAVIHAVAMIAVTSRPTMVCPIIWNHSTDMPAGCRIVAIMPAYNAARTLERTLADVPAGSVDEIILVDDGSRDETVAIAQRLGLRVLRH